MSTYVYTHIHQHKHALANTHTGHTGITKWYLCLIYVISLCSCVEWVMFILDWKSIPVWMYSVGRDHVENFGPWPKNFSPDRMRNIHHIINNIFEVTPQGPMTLIRWQRKLGASMPTRVSNVNSQLNKLHNLALSAVESFLKHGHQADSCLEAETEAFRHCWQGYNIRGANINCTCFTAPILCAMKKHFFFHLGASLIKICLTLNIRILFSVKHGACA